MFICLYAYIYTQTHDFWFNLLRHDRCDSVYIYIFIYTYFALLPTVPESFCSKVPFDS